VGVGKTVFSLCSCHPTKGIWRCAGQLHVAGAWGYDGSQHIASTHCVLWVLIAHEPQLLYQNCQLQRSRVHLFWAGLKWRAFMGRAGFSRCWQPQLVLGSARRRCRYRQCCSVVPPLLPGLWAGAFVECVLGAPLCCVWQSRLDAGQLSCIAGMRTSLGEQDVCKLQSRRFSMLAMCVVAGSAKLATETL